MKQEDQTSSGVRVNCNICGDAARVLHELKDRHIIDSNREAVVQGLFALQERVVKSDIEKSKLRNLTQQTVHLRDWDEIVGTLNGIESTHSGTDIIASLTCTTEKQIAIAIQRDCLETEQQLRNLLGKRVAILKTGNPQKPFIARTLNETKPNNSAPSPREVTSNQLDSLPRARSAKQTPQLRDMLISSTCGVVIGSAGLDFVRGD
jgi:hypothetical protein